MQIPDSFLATRRRARRLARRVALESALAGRRLVADERPFPDFMIIGAQRCGTTSLYRALTAHENVLELVVGAKGAHYFDMNLDRSTQWYRGHFPTTKQRAKVQAATGRPAVVGESSPYYLYHPAGPRRIHELVPESRLVILLRDPVVRAHSHYQHMVFEGHEQLPTFEAALAAEDERLRGEASRLDADPTYRSQAHQHFGYVDRGMYADQIERVYEYFPRDHVLVVATEHLVTDPESVLVDIQRFIGLEPSGAVHLAKHNSGSYDAMPAALRQELAGRFADSNRRVSEITGLHLDWS